MRKGTFSVQTANANSSRHNSRELAPKYLIDSSQKNYYELITPDNEFKNIAQNIYKEKIKQTMQKKQVDNLIQETVLTLQPNQDENDVKDLFKKLNKKYGGHELLEVAIHRDEGYFFFFFFAYYPTKNILFKDNDWYVCSDTSISKPKVTDFDTKVNINEFEKVYNYHAHAKFSMFDRATGKTARMQKKDMSERIKFVSDNLGLAYAPDKATSHIKKSVNQVKDEHLAKARTMEQVKEKESKLLKTTYNQLLATKQDLAAAQNEVREYLKEIGATRKEFAELDQLNRDLKEQLKAKDLTIEEMQSKFNSLKHSLEEKFNELYKEKEHFKSVVELKVVEILDLEPYKDLYFRQEHDLNALQEQNKVLVEKVSSLEEKINSSPNMEQYEHFKKQHEVRGKIIFEEAKQIQELEPEKTNLRKLVDYFKNTINDLKTKVNSLFKRNQELEAENKALKDEIYELKRDRIIESGKDNPHEAIRKTLEHAGLGSRTSASILAELKEQRRQQREEDSPFNVSGSMIKFKENQKKDLNEIIENNRKKEEKERLEQEQQRQRQRDSLTR